uniref:Odorant receptor n=1 Tax=Scaeva pyrastri TaxID=219539 RepID=A0A1B3B798_SCAPY|nr:putative odorant receptor OR11 [Scaeva pyrastri]
MEIGLQIFNRQTKCLRAMGHSLIHQVQESKWQRIPQFFVLFLVVSAQYPMINYAIFHKDDLELVTGCMSIAFTNMLSSIKVLTFLINKIKFLEIINELKTMWQNSGEYGFNYIKGSNIMADRVVNFYFYSVFFTGFYFLLTPLAKIAWAKINHMPIIRELPMPMRFFFDAEHSPVYEYAYIYTGCVTVIVVSYVVAIDGLFIAFAIHLRSHFRLLQHYIENNSFKSNEAAINTNIRSYVKYHSKLLRLAEQICQTFKPIIFVQFLITSLQVCVLVYQLVTNMNNVMIFVVYVAFLVSILIQLLIYCYGGEMLKTESSMVATSVQISKYYNLSPKYRKVLCLVLMRSQKPVIVKAGFYVASLENFMTILKAAMSYITLIQSLEQI